MIKNITAHMVVKNEDRFIWYAVSSVLPYVDQFFIFDTGSDDKTVEIIKTFKSKKIIFEKKGEVDSKKLVELRQEQIDRTETDWIWIVDGDEVYPKNTSEAIFKIINSKKSYHGIIVHRYDLLGDIYHCQDESVGAYNQFGKRGHYVLRLLNMSSFPKLQVKGEYPNEYFADNHGNSIKEKGREYFAFVEERIFHAMYLKRSAQEKDLTQVLNRNKVKIELGSVIPKEDIPEVFFQKRIDIVPQVTIPRGWFYTLLAVFITPIKKLKRKIFDWKTQHGICIKRIQV